MTFAIAFPPPIPWSLLVVAIHAGLIVLAIASVAVYVWRGFAKVQNWEPWFWVASLTTATSLYVCFLKYPYSWHFDKSWAIILSVIVWMIGLSGCLMWLLRSRGAAGGPLNCLLLTIGCVFALSCFTPFWYLTDLSQVARRSTCANQIRRAALAIHNFHYSHRRMPDASRLESSEPTAPRVTWRVQVLPFLEYSALADRYDATKPWDDPVNIRIARIPVDIYSCPSNWNRMDEQQRYYSDFAVLTGKGTIFDGSPRSLDDIADGSSNTLLLVEAAGQQIVWTRPKDIDVSTDPIGINLPGSRPGHSPGWLSSYHRGGTNVAFADGSIHQLSPDISPEVLHQLMTADGGERPTRY